ncbi:hypothetical protein FRC03_002096 [Tulasnella sp. 419]|nr:hypothetical protein FRC03_002096 [Tulasnella sp. 419]
MLPLRLSLAIAQSSAALFSATLLYITRPKTRKVALPIFSGESLDGGHDGGRNSSEEVEELEGGEKLDLFDIAKPIDFVDGIPIDEEDFWIKLRVRKILQTCIITILVVIDAIALGYTIADDEKSTVSNILASGLQLGFSGYLATVSFASIGQSSIDDHWKTTCHLWSLTILATFLYGTRIILPPSSKYTFILGITPTFDDIYDYLNLIILVVLSIITSTTPHGPAVHFPPENIYSQKSLLTTASTSLANVCGIVQASILSVLLFSYSTPVVMLGYSAESLEIRDLPIVPADMRAVPIFTNMRTAYKSIKLPKRWKPKSGSGWDLLYKLLRVNAPKFALQMALASISAVLYYLPAYFLKQLVSFLETAGHNSDRSWAWVYCAGLFVSNAVNYIITGQLWSISTTSLQVKLRVQLNTLLFAKTLIRKDVASTAPPKPTDDDTSAHSTPSHTASGSDGAKEGDKDKEDDFSTKAQIMTLMTTDVDRVAEFSWHFFSLVDAPIEIVIGSFFLYHLLGVSCFFGLAVTCLFLPINHYASKIVISAQDNLMKSRDERVGLMNEILGGIRMLKFMAWERSFEKRVLKIRERELHYQKRNYYIEALFNLVWNASPILVTLVSFWHFTVIRGETLTPSIAFTSLTVFNELKFALNALPETFINMLQSLVSVRRIENYLHSKEVSAVPPLHEQDVDRDVTLNSATITWPKDQKMATGSSTATQSSAATPSRHSFALTDLNLRFPKGELSLVCGKLGSGKTLLLLALLGEADVLAGQIITPRSPPDTIAKFAELREITEDEWIVEGVCAYVPQTAWLQNASIKENILFNLPYDEKRYNATLEACALIPDFKILEDGDEAEIGERGVNLSGGQKARVSLARAVYSRASVLLLDDVLSAVDAHTAHHIYENALKGPLLKGRTVILVSHHVQLCAPGASYIVALDNGKLIYSGGRDEFRDSHVMASLVQSVDAVKEDEKDMDKPSETLIEEELSPGTSDDGEKSSDKGSSVAGSSTAVATESGEVQKSVERKKPRKLVQEEERAVGRISGKIWLTYIKACGGAIYWILFILAFLIAAATPVIENGWLRYWSSLSDPDSDVEMKEPLFYIGVYAALTSAGLVFQTVRWILLYEGSIHASTVLYKRLLKAVLFAHIRFHDTINRGRLLNRFGKDFEGLDSSLADNFGRTLMYTLSAFTTFVTVTYVGGLGFLFAAVVLATLYYQVGKVYGQTSRDMRRLDSVTRSPLYTIYGESIAGVAVLRAFGASTKFLREMQQHVDTNTNPYYWMWSVNRWLSCRFNLLSSAVVGVTGVVVILNPNVDASFAGFALAFASTVTGDLLFMVRRFVGLEQSMVALERVQEFSELSQEPPEFIEPRPPASWPQEGAIEVENLVIRYAPQLPNVLHGLTFNIEPRSKVGVLGRTGGGKSTLALSFFRFVEATEGQIRVDGIDISKIGLTDLRSRLTIIPQDPTILSGTLRSTLDVFDQYEDKEIFEALRRVHLIPSTDDEEAVQDEATSNVNVFRNLDSPVAEGGENFSAGEKQLICMARAILKRSKVLLMDEATASVDYATDELISRTIRQEFAESTIITIAHRLRTVIDYDKVMLLDQGRIVEFDQPSVLLSNPDSKFYALCKSAGKSEFATLKRMAEEAAIRIAERERQ